MSESFQIESFQNVLAFFHLVAHLFLALMPGNSCTFRRRSTAIEVKGELEGALLSVASFEAQYRLYGSCGFGNIILVMSLK